MLRGIEILRIIGLLAVVIIHANALGMFGEWHAFGFVADEVCRFAVPAFFVISGYFWKAEAIEKPARAILSLFVRLAPIFVFWVMFYAVMEFSEVLYPRLFGRDFMVLVIPFSGGPGFHLWFLPAFFIGSGLCWLALRYLGRRATLWLSAALYVVGVALGAYQGLLGLHVPIVVYRNGIFEAPLFMISGYLLRAGSYRWNSRYFALLAAGGSAVHVVEGLWTGQFPLGHDFSFGTVAFAIGMVGIFRGISVLDDHGWGKDVLGAYLIHLFILKVVAAQLPSSGPLYALCASLAVTAISLTISRLLKSTALSRRLVALS